MITINRCDSGHTDFITMVSFLDKELAVIDGRDHDFYNAFNRINLIRHAVVAYHKGQPVGCGAIKVFSDEAMEIKRMYVSPDIRNHGIGKLIVTELENWARELSYVKCVLETGRRQPDAIALYKKCGYQQIPNYGQYIGMENSVCFEKRLK
ncbi:MAG TPA: GNAT family N-acetyltransferase [Bacteroidales bacterium]|nr:GNAT family N-acetyltransferase [Bacteroidales bacterium]